MRFRQPRRFVTEVILVIICFASGASSASAQQFDQKLFAEMRWRCIGPFRGGRTVAISGVPHQPNVFYMAAVNGGVWKTTDAGNTWNPIFDHQPTGSVGALAVAPSDPRILYVGSGEGLQRPDLATGDGIYKSVDEGRTWTHLQDLRDAQQITAILVDPKDPNRIFVAAQGHPYGPNTERGVFRSTDGGQSFQKVLYKDENTGAADLAFDPANPRILYAVLWAARVAPWEVRSGASIYIAGSGLLNPPTAATPGARLPKACPLRRMSWAASGSLWLLQNPIAFTPPSKQSAVSAGFIVPTPAKAGKKQMTTTASAAAVRAQWASRSPLTIPTKFMSPTPPRGNLPTAEKPSSASKARPAATITSASG